MALLHTTTCSGKPSSRLERRCSQGVARTLLLAANPTMLACLPPSLTLPLIFVRAPFVFAALLLAGMPVNVFSLAGLSFELSRASAVARGRGERVRGRGDGR